MFRNSNLVILSLLLPYLTLVPAYYVHSSCGSVPAFRSAINKAFTFASTTVDLYNNKNQNMLEVGEFMFPGNTQQNSIRECQYQKRNIFQSTPKPNTTNRQLSRLATDIRIQNSRNARPQSNRRRRSCLYLRLL